MRGPYSKRRRIAPIVVLSLGRGEGPVRLFALFLQTRVLLDEGAELLRDHGLLPRRVGEASCLIFEDVLAKERVRGGVAENEGVNVATVHPLVDHLEHGVSHAGGVADDGGDFERPEEVHEGHDDRSPLLPGELSPSDNAFERSDGL